MTSETIIPEFTSLFEFYEHIHASPPLDKDFDIRIINPEVLKAYDFIARPFRHKFYCVALYLEGNATLNNGYWKTHLERPAFILRLQIKFCPGTNLSNGSGNISLFLPSNLHFVTNPSPTSSSICRSLRWRKPFHLKSQLRIPRRLPNYLKKFRPSTGRQIKTGLK